MRFGKLFRNLLILVFIGACVVAYLNWNQLASQAENNARFAEAACVDEIHAQFSPSSLSVYRVEETARGFSVRVSVRLTDDRPIRIICVANEFGRVEDVQIDER